MTRIADKTIWITGASGGIGEALALAASQQGSRLILSARRQQALEAVRERCAQPERCATLPLDLLDFDAEQACAQAEALFGPIDVLVNNAGVSQRGTVLDTTLDTHRRIMELDYFAVIALTRAVLPGMIERGGGHVVTVSSVVGHVSSPLRSGYAAAKHALHGYFDAAAAELWQQNIRFTLACPGFVATDVSKNALTGDGSSWDKMDARTAKGMDPAECAARIWRAVEKNRYELLMGPERGFVYLKRWMPGLFATLLRRVDPT